MARTKLLTADEAGLWKALHAFVDVTLARVAADVFEATGLSASEYAVLAELVDLGNGRLRQRDLALALGWDKSRISHQLTRMEVRKLLTRSKTVEYGSRVDVTPFGRDAIARARPAHARAVRRHLVERLTPEQAATIVSLSRAD